MASSDEDEGWKAKRERLFNTMPGRGIGISADGKGSEVERDRKSESSVIAMGKRQTRVMFVCDRNV